MGPTDFVSEIKCDLILKTVLENAAQINEEIKRTGFNGAFFNLLLVGTIKL